MPTRRSVSRKRSPPFAQREIGIDHALDRTGDLVGAERRTQDLADAGILRAGAAELELVIFHALLVDAEDADMAGMMMAAGIDAAGNLDLQLADVVLAFRSAKRAAIFCAIGMARALARSQ